MPSDVVIQCHSAYGKNKSNVPSNKKNLDITPPAIKYKQTPQAPLPFLKVFPKVFPRSPTPIQSFLESRPT